MSTEDMNLMRRLKLITLLSLSVKSLRKLLRVLKETPPLAGYKESLMKMVIQLSDTAMCAKASHGSSIQK